MIITEIKHLNVRISEFEDPIFDKNILPVFITPLILKEVEARKRGKYKIETLNPDKKLTFRIVPFNEIVEELAARINKIAIDLEPHYFIDPSYFNSLPYEVKTILNKNTLKDEKKVIEEASFQISSSTLKGKKHILYARNAFIYYACIAYGRYGNFARKGDIYSPYVKVFKHNTEVYRGYGINHYDRKYIRNNKAKKKIVYTCYGRVYKFFIYRVRSPSVKISKKTINTILKKRDIFKYRKLKFFPVITPPALNFEQGNFKLGKRPRLRTQKNGVTYLPVPEHTDQKVERKSIDKHQKLLFLG